MAMIFVTCERCGTRVNLGNSDQMSVEGKGAAWYERNAWLFFDYLRGWLDGHPCPDPDCHGKVRVPYGERAWERQV